MLLSGWFYRPGLSSDLLWKGRLSVTDSIEYLIVDLCIRHNIAVTPLVCTAKPDKCFPVVKFRYAFETDSFPAPAVVTRKLIVFTPWQNVASLSTLLGLKQRYRRAFDLFMNCICQTSLYCDRQRRHTPMADSYAWPCLQTVGTSTVVLRPKKNYVTRLFKY